LRGRKYWRKRQTCNGNVVAVEDTAYGDRVPFLGCPGGSVTTHVYTTGMDLFIFMGDEMKLTV